MLFHFSQIRMSEILSIIQEDKRQPPQITSELGSRGEVLAADYLVRNGYRLVVANFKVPVGRNSKGVQVTGEIDIIALDGETLVFIEVKTRRSDEFTPVLTNVNLRKQRQITRTAKVYRRIFGIRDVEYRFDVVTVLMPKHAEPTIELTKGFWKESKFRKRTWDRQVWQEFV
jgi:putative endonuclease